MSVPSKAGARLWPLLLRDHSASLDSPGSAQQRESGFSKGSVVRGHVASWWTELGLLWLCFESADVLSFLPMVTFADSTKPQFSSASPCPEEVVSRFYSRVLSPRGLGCHFAHFLWEFTPSSPFSITYNTEYSSLPGSLTNLLTGFHTSC